MNILIDIVHPAHVHLTRNAYFELTAKGHKVTVTTRNMPSAMSLLDNYKIPYICFGKKRDSLIGKAFLQILYNLKIIRLIISKKIEIGFGSSLALAQISKITPMKSIILDDDDDDVEPLFVKYGHPFASAILSPDCTRRKSPQAIFYAGYHELAYLHPKRFTPDKNILSEIGVKEGEPFFILRFNAFKAHHDAGVQGLSVENKRKIIKYLETKGKVFITTERNIDEEFLPYQLKISPEKIHSLIYYAEMLIGDSQTMTSEAAFLGTPSIRCNSFAGKISVIDNDEEQKYNLAYSFLPSDFDRMLEKIDEILKIPNLKDVWQQRKDIMLKEKIDVTKFFVWFIEKFPNSKKIMLENPDYQYNFK
jgi:predicted glycosyltransferase